MDADRPLIWLGSPLDDLRRMPEDVKDTFGYALQIVQEGGTAPHVKPLRGFGGASVLEIRDDFDGDTYRTVFTVRFADAIYVLHAFQKKSRVGRKTSQHDLALIRQRLADAAKHHSEHFGGRV
jgi:phage-related protein